MRRPPSWGGRRSHVRHAIGPPREDLAGGYGTWRHAATP